ncbi:c-type cytochrome biogenesis protein CcsB, partial [Nocardia cyriacigeorgica]|nr:c-type cytochrome biogenesis protein CcsB [Nocardia cyriacigeorgica]
YASVRTRKVVERELVPAGGGDPLTLDPAVPGKVVEAPRLPLSERLGNMAFSVLYVAVGLHVLSIVLRGFATHRFPLGNMYEFVTMATAATAVVGLVFLRDQ